VNESGCTVPVIDAERCISCGLCERVCPSNKKLQFKDVQKCYAAWSLNETDQTESSSGGVAAVFTRHILKSGGSVIGSAFDPSCMARQIEISDSGEADRLRGSKYVQSYSDRSYIEAKRKLDEGASVLYIGTPCLVAGCQSFLKKEYEKFLSVDIICHGTAPARYLEEHVLDICKSKAHNISFRGKNNYYICVYDEHDQEIYKRKNDEDLYFSSFLAGLVLRENCFQCKYARPERISDITIGDFWGIEKTTLKEPYEGRISVVLVNTQKGADFLKECEQELHMEERQYDEARKFNEQLNYPTEKHPDREQFLKLYPQIGFDQAVAATSIGKSVHDKIDSHKMTSRIKRRIKNILK
jgi:coenzyme F420-reducing hydrogenase beta subunit